MNAARVLVPRDETSTSRAGRGVKGGRGLTGERRGRGEGIFKTSVERERGLYKGGRKERRGGTEEGLGIVRKVLGGGEGQITS